MSKPDTTQKGFETKNYKPDALQVSADPDNMYGGFHHLRYMLYKWNQRSPCYEDVISIDRVSCAFSTVL